MRKIIEDTVLGTSKIIWQFDTEANKTKPETPPVMEDVEVSEEESNDGIDLWGLDTEKDTEKGSYLYQGLTNQQYIEDMRQQIAFLKQVIEDQSSRLKTKDELILNFQILLKTEQEQVAKLAENGKNRIKLKDVIKKILFKA